MAALVSPQDLERLRRYDAEREVDFAVIDRMRAAFHDVPDEELERELARAQAEARAELRVERAQAAPTPFGVSGIMVRKVNNYGQ